MPRVSIVLPNYNYAQYLEERVRSLLYQSYADFELVIVDDASTDESTEVLASFDDPRIRLHLRSSNSGKVYATWNEALAHCNGEYVLFAGADDVAEARMLERLLRPLEADPTLGFSHCRLILIDAAGHIIGTEITLPPSASFILGSLRNGYVAPARVDWQRLLVTNFVWNASAVLLRRTAVEEVGGFDDDLLIAADWLLYLEIARRYGVAYVGEPLNAFRKLEKSVSTRMQGARLVDELFTCLTRQEPHLRPEDLPYYRAGIQNADDALRHYLTVNRKGGDDAEVERLRQVASKFQRAV